MRISKRNPYEETALGTSADERQLTDFQDTTESEFKVIMQGSKEANTLETLEDAKALTDRNL